MAISLTHAFQSAVPDDGDPNKVGSNEWNAEHQLTLGANALIGRGTGDGAAQEIPATAFARGLLGAADAAAAVGTLGLTNARLPVGAVAMWFTEAVPDTTWLELNGAQVSRTTYAALFALWGNTFGAGNGSTTFTLPDIRGRFVRGWDHGAGLDPDAASRTSRGDGTTGDRVGTKQADAFRLHGHPYRVDDTLLGTPDADSDGGFILSADGANNKAAFTGTPSNSQQIGGSGGNETRPVNIAVMFIVKAL